MKKRERLNKRMLALAMVLVMIAGLIPSTVFAQTENTSESNTIAFTVGEAGYWMDNTWVESDATPYIQANRIMVPVAHASRALGAAVTWQADTKEVEVAHNGDTYTLTIGSAQLQKNGELLEEMDTVPVIQDLGNGLGRTMLPVSRLAKVLNVDYTWDADSKTATFMPMATEGPVVYDEAGTYGPEEDTETIDNDVIISADDVILQNLVITGNLTITEAVGDGDVTLNNITVEGDTFIKGGGTDSIHINGGSYGNIIVQRTPSGALRVVVTGQNRLNIEVDEEAEEQILILEGLYDKVVVTAPNVRIITRGETQINELIITDSATNTTLETSNDTTIEKAVVDGEGAVFEGGEGTVKEVEGDQEPDDKNNVVVQLPTPNGGGGGGSTGGSTTPSTVEISAVSITGDAMVGKILTAVPSPSNATGNYQWQFSDNGTSSWTDIPEATTSTYLIAPEYASKYIRVSITGTESFTGTQTSDETEQVDESNDANLVSVLGVTDINPAGNGETPETPFTWEISVANTVETLEIIDIEVAIGATPGIYSDASFSANSIASIPLSADEPTVAYIRVTAQDTSARYYAVTINRAAIAVESVSINADTNRINIGETTQLIAVVQPLNATNQTVTWSSSDNGVATVDNSGLVTGVAVGQTEFTVTTNDGGHTATRTITVENKEIQSVEVISDINVAFGTTLENVGLPETVEVTLDDASTENLSITWNGGTPPYGGNTAGTYVFEGTITLATGISNTDGYKATVNVIVGVAPDQTITLAAIPGIVAPIPGATPVTDPIDTDQYTGTITWNPDHETFEESTNYTATITLTSNDGFTLTGVSENFFTVAGASSVINAENSGVVTAEFQTADFNINSESINIIEDGTYIIMGTGEATTNTITVTKDVYADITLNNVNIDVSSISYTAAFEIANNSTGNVNITLVGENTLRSGFDRAGLQKNGIADDVGTLTIGGEGSLTATSGGNAAGIGGGFSNGTSNITINGGTIMANSISYGAGIGGGRGSSGIGKNIKISGGEVTAIGSAAAGIGRGEGGSAENNSIAPAEGMQISVCVGSEAPGTLLGTYTTTTPYTNTARYFNSVESAID